LAESSGGGQVESFSNLRRIKEELRQRAMNERKSNTEFFDLTSDDDNKDEEGEYLTGAFCDSGAFCVSAIIIFYNVPSPNYLKNFFQVFSNFLSPPDRRHFSL